MATQNDDTESQQATSTPNSSRGMLSTELPPAYTPYSSVPSVFQGITNQHPDVMLFLKSERQILQILGISSTILGGVSMFMSVLTIVFNTVMFCTGTGFWGGCTSVVNGILILFRYRQHNTWGQVFMLTVFCFLTIMSCVASISLALIGTSVTSTACCYSALMPTQPTTGVTSLICNMGASQMANSCIASIAFVEIIIAIMIAIIFSKYFWNCHNYDNIFYPSN